MKIYPHRDDRCYLLPSNDGFAMRLPSLPNALAAIGCLATLAIPPAIAQEASFRNWSVSCSSTDYCVAGANLTPTAGEADPGEYVLSIGRHREQSYWEISLTAFAAKPDPWKGIAVTVDGESETFSPPTEAGAYGRPEEIFFLGDKAQRVMDRLMPGSAIAIAFTDLSGQPHEATFSLSGLTAALIWIDEKQRRLGSERVASVPPYGLLPAGEDAPPPEIPQALLDRHAGDPECEPFEALANGRDFEAARLDDNHAIYFIPCWSAAYNFGWKAYVAYAFESFALQYFAEFSDELGWRGTPWLVNYWFDAATGELGTYNKARGPGDCGSSGLWRWQGYAFRLVEFRAAACSDDIGPEAELGEFPLVYSATERPAP